ncbi:MAG TPA: hypothetical protein VNT60_08750 [Deinococcales bacterium]|nr:hypothetical protein [Deinococcales bacterium]
MRRLLAVLVLAVSTVAVAATLQDALGQYAKGDFQEAATTAAGLRTAEGYALAAKATSIFATTRPEREQDALFVKAEALANQAIAADARVPEGYFERARALGRLSQLRGVLQALAQGYGGRVKADLEKALQLRPNYASALVAFGLWHAEIASKGAIVNAIYGGDASRVALLMDRAIALEPDVPIHRIEYAKALMLLDAGKNKERARALLTQASGMRASDAAERLDIERAKRELAELK